MPDTETIASLGFVFRSIRRVLETHSAVVFNATNGREKEVTNLGWLLRHTHEIHDLYVSTDKLVQIGQSSYGAMYGPKPLRATDAGCDAVLAVRLSNGLVYATTWQSQDLLHDWLVRPKLLGRPVYWNHHGYMIGDRDYERCAWERRKRRERERRIEEQRVAHMNHRIRTEIFGLEAT